MRTCAVAAACAAPALAQQDAEVGTTAGGLEEVTVTARRREEVLQDVPISISAFSGDTLESAGALDITWLQQTTPNLTLQVARGSNSTLIAFIRGVGQQDPLWGFEPGVGLYVDDVYVARPQGAVLDIFDIERIEELRGPQGTLYGRNTIGGAIRYVSRPLGDEERFDGRINLGSYGQQDVIISMATPVTATFSIGASGAFYRRDGYGTNKLSGQEHYDKDVDAARVSAEWRPADELLFRLTADRVVDKSNPKHGHREAPGMGLAAGDPVFDNVYDTYGGVGDDNYVKTQGVSLLAQWGINDVLTFKSISAYRDGETDTVIDFDITDAFSASLGGRWTRGEREGTVYRQNFTGLYSPLFGNPGAVPGLVRSDYTNDNTFEEFTPRVSLTYEFSPDLTTYAAYSEGFKSGGFDMRGDAVLTPDTVDGYDPEYVKSYEGGLKGGVFDQRLGFSLALFRAEYEGQQITRQEPTVFGGIASFVDNAANSTIQGVELEGTIRFTDSIWATYGVGYTDAEFDEYITTMVITNPPPPPATITVPIDLSDTAQFQNTPEWNGNLALNYRLDFDSSGPLLTTVRGSYRSEYSMFEFENPLIDQTEDYTLVDADLVWTLGDGRTSIGLHGRNLTDEAYKIGGYYVPGADFGNVVSSFYGPPRTYTLTLGYSFR